MMRAPGHRNARIGYYQEGSKLGIVTPDANQTKQWLQQARIEHYICEHCHGLHLSEVQQRDGVVDSRLFVEDDGLLLSSELELRPAALFAIQADMARLNMTYPSLKLFLDVDDESLPRLVACDLLLGRQGVSFEQFIYFVQATVDGTIQLLDECQEKTWLMWPEEGAPAEKEALH